MGERNAVLWISDAQAEAARSNWCRFRELKCLPCDDQRALDQAYLIGVIDTLGITSPAAIVDALAKITAGSTGEDEGA